METEHGTKKGGHKEVLKRLRSLRQETVQRVAAQVKSQKKTVAALTKCLRHGPKTVPEMAEETGLPPHEVLWWTASLKKYGIVQEAEKKGAYFAYRLSEPPAPENAKTADG